MGSSKTRRERLKLIYFFVFVKIAIHFIANSNYGFHRDELLHLALGEHLDWGFKEVPPFIAFIAKLSTLLFGNSVFAVRIFSTMAGAFIVYLSGLIVLEFRGGKWAIVIASLGIIFSPALLATGYLLQPVVFDQLWWLFCLYAFIKYLNTSQQKYLIYLGLGIGLGMMTKYTMAFFVLGLLIGICCSKERVILWQKKMLIVPGIAMIIFLPNLIWQFTHHLPVATHMEELQNSQLHHIKTSDFMVQQFTANGAATLIWLAGFFGLLFIKRLQKYRFIAFTVLAVFCLFLAFHGKPYYAFGIYPTLLAVGGCVLERTLRSTISRLVLAACITVPNLIFLPLVVPVLPIAKAIPFFEKYQQAGLGSIFKWEDQQIHPLTQDYADMFGWDELTQKVVTIYQQLPKSEQSKTVIFGSNYGQAGAVNHLGKAFELPEAQSLSSSFTLWASPNLQAKHLIYIDDGTIEKIKGMFKSWKKVGELHSVYARENGTSIYFLSEPDTMIKKLYREEWELKISK